MAEEGMESYKCKVCGYVYDPVKGDAVAGVDPNTPWAKVPEGYVCPLCGVGKDQFEAVAQ